MKFSEVVAAIKTGLAPKTLDQAKASIATAQPALDSISALFAAANLDLDAMLAAGPDSLKAHIETLFAKDGELATVQEKASELEAANARLTTQKATAETALATANGQISALHASIGFKADAKDKDGKVLDFKTAFTAHVAKEAALVLAKDGRPPVQHAGGKDPKEVVKDPNAKGRDRYQADFHAQALRLTGRS